MPADIISTVEFNHDGEYLATGDKGGRVVIFQRGGLPVVSVYSTTQFLVQLKIFAEAISGHASCVPM